MSTILSPTSAIGAEVDSIAKAVRTSIVGGQSLAATNRSMTLDYTSLSFTNPGR